MIIFIAEVIIYIHTTQAGFCSFSATNLIVSAGIDLENVDKAKLAAGPIFSIIDLVCGNSTYVIHMETIQPGFYKY